MATSSIFHHFVVEGEEAAERFMDAFDRSMYLEEWNAKHPDNKLNAYTIDEEDFAKWLEKVDANG